MTWFGWILTALLSLALTNPRTDNKARWVLLALIFGVLVVGTGNGL